MTSPPAPPAAAGPSLGRRLAFGVALGLAVVVGMMLWSDARALGRVLSDFAVLPVLGAVGLSLVGYGLRIARWELYLARLDIRLPRGESALLFLAGLVMSITPGKVGEVLKSFLLREARGVPVAQSAPIVVAERLTDLVALLALAVGGVAASGHGTGVVAAGAVLVGSLWLVFAWPAAGRLAVRVVGRLPGVRAVAPRLEEARVAMAQLIGPRVLAGSTALALGAWGCESLGTWLVIGAFPGAAASVGQATFVFAFATVAGALSMLPGGLLATESSMVALLTVVFHLAPDEQTATAITLIVRFATLWLGVGLGALALQAFRRRYLGRPAASPAAPPAAP